MKNKILFFLISCITTFTTEAQYNYLGSFTSDGFPNYLVAGDNVTASTLALVHNALPEGYPVPTYNPQYISSGYDTDIQLSDSAEVWVTFVDEGAGYKNVLGFYSYSLDNPPTSIPAYNQISIIFPNISKAGSGGSLVAGNKVRLGSFSANTGIGFVLIADGFRNGGVTGGNWRLFSNPAFNPEANASLKYHNVLIKDSSNERIILGFEDIRRDNGGCDNDFNDALFYVTASPYTAMRTSNIVSLESANASIQSGNSGGLESNGRMAQLIAKRSFARDKNPALRKTRKEEQLPADPTDNILARPFTRGSLNTYFPVTGMFGTESSYNSTPSDLLQITNAAEIYSADYYNGSERVSAGLATYTSGRVYDHTKSICDRLNGASIEEIRTVLLRGHKMINTTFRKPGGEIEYAICFSIQLLPNEYRLHSYWNLDQYPVGDYLNFQTWGKNMGQVCALANAVIEKLESEETIVSNPSLTIAPAVYVKKGQYSNGKLMLTIVNKALVNTVTVNGSYTPSETMSLQPFTTSFSLNGEKEKEVVISDISLFDMGFSISYTGAPVNDALYLADGAWGVDYNNTEAGNIQFAVAKNQLPYETDKINIERNPTVKGTVKGTVNLFRNTKAGNTPLNISGYSNLSFQVQSDKPVEIVLVSNDLTNWNQRARYTIAAGKQARMVTIPLSSFKDSAGNTANIDIIKTIVFTTQGNYQQFIDFNIAISKVTFNNTKTTPEVSINTTVKVFPNPISTAATFQLPAVVKSGTLNITDVTGKIIRRETFSANNGTFSFYRNNIPSGIYMYHIIGNDNQSYNGKITIR